MTNPLTPLIMLIRRANPREKALLTALVAVLAWAWVLVASDAADTAAQHAREARATRQLTEASARVLADPALLALVAAEERKLRGWALVEPTIEIAQLRAQGDLDTLARGAGIGNPQVAVDADGGARVSGGIGAFRIKVEGAFDPASFAAFVQALAASRTLFRPVGIAVVQVAGAPRLAVEIEAIWIAGEARS